MSRAHIVSQTSAHDASQSVKSSSLPLPAPSPSASSLLVARVTSASSSRHFPLDDDLQQPLHSSNTRSNVDLISSSSPHASPSSRPHTPSRATSARAAASSAFVKASQLIDRSELRREVAPRVSAKASDGRASGCCEGVEMTKSCASLMEAAPPISQKRSAHSNGRCRCRCTTSSAQAPQASSSPLPLPRTKQAAASFFCSSEEPPAARDARRSKLLRPVAVDCQRSAANCGALRAIDVR
ncbi:hypothetical protein CBOM_01026 [Ceraceosorus bombacis]|uniref:Uncharacterized protein n=1 Tax=Ceraceosorus bombacis TaxID=401625 RepID=A0A0P1BC78_9BASI|nr:hypothetical protein CBOM_01026 [Ceraceosorus bombacis]